MLELLSVDFTILPDTLLQQAKQHMRVDFTRDDDYIRQCVARAIAEVEASTDLSINPAAYRWHADWQWDRCVYPYKDRYKIHKTPVRTVSQWDGAAWVPVAFIRSEFDIYLQDWNGGSDLQIEVGYETAAQIAPSVLNPILMIAATLYETRESLQAGSLPEIQDMTRRLMTGLWRPSV